MVTAGGFALAALSPMPVGKQVFLLVIGPITTVMHGMTPAAATVKKAAFGRSKSPADAGKKIADCGSPSPALPEGTEKVPFFYDPNGKCLRFVTSLSANRLK